MTFINELISVLNKYLWSYILIVLLIGLGIYFSFKTRFVQFRYLKEMFRLLQDGFSKNGKKNGVSSFQAFCISTASRVGTGNLAGIAIAISLGGPGAIFWMWIIAFIGAASSFVESTLAQVYKVKDKDGTYRGGPAYYMERALGQKWMGIIFSILIILAFGLILNSVQSNTITAAFEEAFGINNVVIGIILTVITFFTIFGGLKRIAKISGMLVPIMAIAYIIVAIFVIIINIDKIPSVFSLIFQNAFGIKQAVAGGIGAALINGIRRGLFSNEAGMGSAPNAAATAEVSHPVNQGLIQTLGVFTDTIIICSCTAFIILLSDIDLNGNLTGIKITQNALSSQVGSWGTYFIAICILLFAFSSIIGNYYYGEANIEFLSTKKIYLIIYRLSVVAMVFIGSVANLNLIWDLADVFMGFMAIFNLIAITLLSPIAFKVLKDYQKQKNSGITQPLFKASSIEGLKHADEWK